jgi:hypothetical protein
MITLPLLSLLFSDVIVSGETTCPSPQLVSAALAEGVTDAQSEGRLHLSNSAQGTALTFTDAVGQARTRILPSTGSCEDQAVRASVVVAAWLAAPESLSLPPIDVHLQAAPLPVEIPTQWLVAAGPRLSFDSAGLGWGGQADVTMQPATTRLGGRARIGALGPRSIGLGAGQANWMQFDLAPTVTCNFANRSAFHAEVDAGPLLSVVTAKGQDFPSARRDASVAWGAEVSLRGHFDSSLPMFVELRGAAWVHAPRVVVTTSDEPNEVAKLRMLSAMISFGFSFRL